MSFSLRWAACVVLAAGLPASAQVAGWRTGSSTGEFPQADPPIDWTAPQNVLWSTPLEGWTNSSPVVLGDAVLTQVEPNVLVCVDAATGAIRWQARSALHEAIRNGPRFTEAQFAEFQSQQTQREHLRVEVTRLTRDARRDPAVKAKLDEVNAKIAALDAILDPLGDYAPPSTHDTNGYTSATPTTDGRRVYTVSGMGFAAAYDMADGARAWITHIQRPRNGWGEAASPLLAGDTVVVLIDDMVGLDAATGEERWRLPGQFSYGSPILAEVGGSSVVVTPRGALLEPTTGKPLGQIDGIKLSYDTPVFDRGVVYFIQEAASAYRLSRRDDGTIAAEMLWEQSLAKDRHYATPVIHDGLIYAITAGAKIQILRAGDGAVEKVVDLAPGTDEGGSVYPSPVLAGGRLFYFHEKGRVCVYRPGAAAEHVATMQLDGSRTTPAFVGDRVYVRTRTHLTCLTKPLRTAAAE